MTHVTTRNLLTKGRRALMKGQGTVLVGVALLAMIAGPLTVMNDNWSSIGIGIVITEMLVLSAGLIWLAMLSGASRSGRRSSHNHDTPSHRR